MNVIIFSHSAQGVLFVAQQEVLDKPDEQLTSMVTNLVKERYPSLTRHLELENYQESFITRYAEGDAQIEIMGDNGILYIDVAIQPVLGIKEPDHIMAEAMISAI